MYFQICCICTSQTTFAFTLDCNHKYCQVCFKNVHYLSKKAPFVQCPICLKSGREQIKPYPRYSSIKHQQSSFNQNHKSTIHNNQFENRNNKLYCFNCQVLFSTQQYINGHHKSHKVKTQEEATSEFQQQHLRSLKILETKSQQFKRKQISLEAHLNQMYQNYQNTKTQIKCYFDNLIIEVEKQRDRKQMQLQQLHNKSVQIVSNNIQQIKQDHKNCQSLERIIKYFCMGEMDLQEITRIKEQIKQLLQLVPVKISLPKLPKLIQANDATFYIKNSLTFVVDNESILNETGDMKSQIDTDVQSFEQTIPRKVRLVEKVKNQLNPSCKLLKNDYYFFEF